MLPLKWKHYTLVSIVKLREKGNVTHGLVVYSLKVNFEHPLKLWNDCLSLTVSTDNDAFSHNDIMLQIFSLPLTGSKTHSSKYQYLINHSQFPTIPTDFLSTSHLWLDITQYSKFSHFTLWVFPSDIQKYSLHNIQLSTRLKLITTSQSSFL